MERLRGYWWSPDGDATRGRSRRRAPRSTLAHRRARSIPDGRRVRSATRAPAPTTPIVTLAIVDLDGGRVDVAWDRDAFPYLVNVVWNAHGPLTVLVESRDQRTMQILRVDPDTGATGARPRGSRRPVARHHRRGPGMASRRPPGAHRGRRGHQAADVRRRARDARSACRWRRSSMSATVSSFRANEDPTETHVWRVDAAGTLTRLTDEPGVHTAVGRLERHGADVGHDDRPADVPRARRRRVRRRDRVHDRDTRAPHDPDVLRRRCARSAHGALHAGRRRARWSAAGVAGSVRRSALRGRPEGAHVAARVAVVRGPGVRGARDRRAGDPGSRSGLGSRGVPEPRGSRARGSGRRPPRRGGARTRSSTSAGSRSAAGRSVGSWRRWRCSAGPTCSTPR